MIDKANIQSKVPFILILFLLSLSFRSNAQRLYGNENIVRLVEDNQLLSINEKLYIDIEGDPFLFDDFMLGKIVFLDNTISVDPILLQYDAYKGIFLFKIEGNIYEISNPINAVLFGERRFINTVPGTDGFVEVLFDENNVQVLKKQVCDLKKEEEKEQLYGKHRKTRFVDAKPAYFILQDTSNLTAVKNKKQMQKAFSDANINNFIKAQKLNFKDVADVLELASFLARK